MMLLSLFPVVLLSLRATLVGGVAEPHPTFTDRDPNTGRTVVCDRCPPGTYLRARCTDTQKSECAPCPAGSFTELWNYIGKCLRCGVCSQNQVVKTACSADSDCQCECKQGYYYEKKYDMCLRHSECQSGQGVLTKGTADEDTVCQMCPKGTYSDTVSAHQNCTEHKHCNASGLELVLKGSTWHDSVCASCEGLRSRDGADYLKEILPAFFVHQKMPITRLRRVVQRLPSEGDRKQKETSGLNLSDLHVRINTWVASATAKQIRQLPKILPRANSAGERLQRKLQRIDSHLNELCFGGNEVNVV
ncbi:tumor necrosis factor receptor superfamily member 6B-like [Siniperca chuatsi]|uniref:tumor necrosis factor receptor superfamily member 6B-like n=1 Tax=Siniperca chuatsi TaxID=119488 RepID=UPI001CE046AA|nr:tumor necrosis factor receptor superfamily member 6B-like [Siniperca chuatsi]